MEQEDVKQRCGDLCLLSDYGTNGTVPLSQGREDLEKKKAKKRGYSLVRIIPVKKIIENISKRKAKERNNCRYMRKLWVCDDWSQYIDFSCRKGLRKL